MLLCFGITWVPIAGLLLIFVCYASGPHKTIPIAKIFYLQDLDAADYEEAPRIPFNIPTVKFLRNSCIHNLFPRGSRVFFAEGREVLDEMITRSHGEVKHT